MIYKVEARIDHEGRPEAPKDAEQYQRLKVVDLIRKKSAEVVAIEEIEKEDYKLLRSEFVLLPISHWEHIERMMHVLHTELTVRGETLLAGMVAVIKDEIVNR